VEGYTRDAAYDFAAADRLLDMTDAPGLKGIDRLERLVREREIRLLVQVGSPQAYRQLPYLKERIPNLQILDTLYNPVGHTISHFLYEGAFDGVIVESVAMRDYVLANTAKRNPRVHLVESGIDLDEFKPSPRQTMMPDSLTLGYLGRMSPEKNPLGFVMIAERLHASHPTLRFRIFGEGGMEREVRARADASTAKAMITFEGYAAHARDALHAMDVLVVPSKLDGRPNAVMEASGCGVPVLAAPVGGIPELIEDGVNGHLVSLNDHARFERLVGAWLDDPAVFSRLQRSSRAKAESDFARQRMLERYAEVFAGAPQSAGHSGPAPLD
jgi:glycosyltransferase involved in cell wall biosynthesis